MINWLRVFAFWLLLAPLCAAQAADSKVRIGVLSHRGTQATLSMWSPTADYLSIALSDRRFHIVPLDFADIDPAVGSGEVDFLLVNPGIYVNMEVRHRVSRIATLNNLVGTAALNVFGGVVFTRADRRDIDGLTDLRGRSLMAVDETSLGGFQMAWRELRAADIEPHSDISNLSFGGTHDQVVMAVREGRVDVGTVRTDILERMAAGGVIEPGDFKILNPQHDAEFPFALSTRLYPEWPFSKLRDTPNELAQRVAVALLNMPADHPAARAGNYAGWTVPLEYQPVHDLFRDLKLPPYGEMGRFTLADAIARYWHWLLVAAVFLLAMAFMTTWVARLNRQLQRSKRHLERQHDLILDSVADGIYGVDLDGNATFVNRAMEELSGWSADDLIGSNQHAILHHTHADGSPHPPSECPVYLTFHHNEPRFVADDLFWRKDGSGFPVEYSSTPIRDQSGEAIGSVVVFRDISERKASEEEARQHQRDLAHVARLSTMGEMASGIAHELNQPLTAIATTAYACLRLLDAGTHSTDKLAEAVQKVAAQAERAGDIIRQLRKFVLKDEPDESLVDLNRLVEGVLVLIGPEIRLAGVRIRREMDDGIPLVMAQQIQIEQVVVNLARNAIEAMSEVPADRRELLIRTRTGGGHAVIVTVADTGPGLSDEIRDRLFSPFITTKANGMGLGLSISLGIIEAHGGNLYLDSEPGYGAVFRFALPLH